MNSRASLALGWLLIFPVAALAADAQGVSTSLGSSSVTSSLFQTLLALFLVVGAIVGSAWLLKRFGPTQMSGGGAMKVLGGVAVGPRERLVLVEVGETWLIVGVAPGQVNTVLSMPRPEDASLQSPQSPGAVSFSERLKQVLGPRQG